MAKASTIETERDLVRRARAGDHGAFECLYRREVGRVYAVCLRMVGDPRRAEGLTQDAFVRAWRHLDGFRGESAFSTWLHRIVVNEVLMALRAARRRRAHVTERDGFPQEGPAVRDGQGAQAPDLASAAPVAAREAALDLERAIAALPEQARTVLVLHDIEGYCHREIGEMLEIAEGTSKAHLHHARKSLRAMLT